MQHVSLLSKKKNKNKNAVAWTRPHVPCLCIVPVHSQQVSSFSVLKETLRKRSKQLKHFRFLFSSQSVLTQTKHLVYRERLLKKEALKTCTILIAIPHSAAFFFFFFEVVSCKTASLISAHSCMWQVYFCAVTGLQLKPDTKDDSFSDGTPIQSKGRLNRNVSVPSQRITVNVCWCQQVSVEQNQIL